MKKIKLAATLSSTTTATASIPCRPIGRNPDGNVVSNVLTIEMVEMVRRICENAN